MFLSNLRKSFLLALMYVTFLQACGSSSNNENRPISLNDDATNLFPFPTREPEVYQGDFVVGNGINEERYFVARKGDRWRFDVMQNNVPRMTQLCADRVYLIDHTKRTYTVEQYADQKDFDASYFNSLTWGFFRGANYLEFEEVERGGGLIRYKAKTYKDSKSDVLITIDEATGIMVRQEITGEKDRMEQGSPVNYIYEVRNLKVDVDDSVFEIPAGYRSVTR
jgi:hypothetical protein